MKSDFMNKNMQATLAAIEGLRNLDHWPESEIKTSLIAFRKALDVDCFKNIYTIPEDVAKRMRSSIKYADPLGNPISMFEWCVCNESVQKHVAEDYFVISEKEDESIRVSTVWLGLDHAYLNQMPLIFETMIFGIKDDEELDRYQERYGSLSEAEEGHGRAMTLVIEYLKLKNSLE